VVTGELPVTTPPLFARNTSRAREFATRAEPRARPTRRAAFAFIRNSFSGGYPFERRLPQNADSVDF
jgi:hypothetical protein